MPKTLYPDINNTSRNSHRSINGNPLTFTYEYVSSIEQNNHQVQLVTSYYLFPELLNIQILHVSRNRKGYAMTRLTAQLFISYRNIAESFNPVNIN